MPRRRPRRTPWRSPEAPWAAITRRIREPMLSFDPAPPIPAPPPLDEPELMDVAAPVDGAAEPSDGPVGMIDELAGGPADGAEVPADVPRSAVDGLPTPPMAPTGCLRRRPRTKATPERHPNPTTDEMSRSRLRSVLRRRPSGHPRRRRAVSPPEHCPSQEEARRRRWTAPHRRPGRPTPPAPSACSRSNRPSRTHSS